MAIKNSRYKSTNTSIQPKVASAPAAPEKAEVKEEAVKTEIKETPVTESVQTEKEEKIPESPKNTEKEAKSASFDTNIAKYAKKAAELTESVNKSARKSAEKSGKKEPESVEVRKRAQLSIAIDPADYDKLQYATVKYKNVNNYVKTLIHEDLEANYEKYKQIYDMLHS